MKLSEFFRLSFENYCDALILNACQITSDYIISFFSMGFFEGMRPPILLVVLTVDLHKERYFVVACMNEYQVPFSTFNPSNAGATFIQSTRTQRFLKNI